MLIITDFETDNCAQLLAGVAYILGAEVEMCVMIPRELDGQEPTASIAAAMKKTEVILIPVNRSIGHSTAVREALAEGARVLSLTASSEELMASEAYKADFRKQRPMVEKVEAGLGNLCNNAPSSTQGVIVCKLRGLPGFLVFNRPVLGIKARPLKASIVQTH